VCPLFLPVSALPLAGIFTGECSADPGALIPLDTLRECCNRGYARDTCQRAAAIDADAATFLVKSDREGTVQIAWAIEKNHHPVSVGTLAVGPSPEKPDTLAIQAGAIAAMYRRRKGRN
jgi:hypothetical protein